MLKKNYNNKNLKQINFVFYFLITYKNKKQHASTFISNDTKIKVINKLNIVDTLNKCCLHQLNFRCNEIINQTEYNYNELSSIDLSIFGTSIRGLSNSIRFYRIRGEEEILEKDIDIVDMCRLPPLLVIYIYYSFINYEYFKLFNEDNPFDSVYTDLKVDFKKKKKISMFMPPKIKPLRSSKRDTYLSEYTKIIKRQLNKEKTQRKNFLASKNEYEIDYESEDEVKNTHKIELRKMENLKKATKDLIIFEKGKFIEKKIRQDKHILTESELITKYSLIGDGSKKYWFQCLGILEAYDDKLYKEKAKLYKYRKMPKKIKKSLNINLISDYTTFLLNQKMGVGLLENLTNIKLKEINTKIENTQFEAAIAIEEEAVAIEEEAVAIEEEAVAIEEEAVAIEEEAVAIEEEAVAIEEEAVAIEEDFSEIEPQCNSTIKLQKYNLDKLNKKILTISKKLVKFYSILINKKQLIISYKNILLLQKNNINYFKKVNIFSIKKKKTMIDENNNYEDIIRSQIYELNIFEEPELNVSLEDELLSEDIDELTEDYSTIEETKKDLIEDYSPLEEIKPIRLNRGDDFLKKNNSRLKKIPLTLDEINAIDFTKKKTSSKSNIKSTNNKLSNIKSNNTISDNTNSINNVHSTVKTSLPFTLEKFKDDIDNSYKSELNLEDINLENTKKPKKTKKKLLNNDNKSLLNNNILEIQSILEKINLIKLKDLEKINKLLTDNTDNKNLVKIQSILKKININTLKDLNNNNQLSEVQTILEKMKLNNLKQQQNILKTNDLDKIQFSTKEIDLDKKKTKKKKLKNDIDNTVEMQHIFNEINLIDSQGLKKTIEVIDKNNNNLVETKFEDSDSEDEFSCNKFLKTFKNIKTEQIDKNEILNNPNIFDNYNNFLESLNDREKAQIKKNKLLSKNSYNWVETQQQQKIITDNYTNSLDTIKSKLKENNVKSIVLNFKDFFIDYNNHIENFNNISNSTMQFKLKKIKSKTPFSTENIKNSVEVRSILKKIDLIKKKNLKNNILQEYSNDIFKNIETIQEEVNLINPEQLKKKKKITKKEEKLLQNTNINLVQSEVTSKKINLNKLENIQTPTQLISCVNTSAEIQPIIKKTELIKKKTLKEKKELEKDNVSLAELRSIFNDINLIELQEIKKIRYRVPKKKNKLSIDDINLDNTQLALEETTAINMQISDNENKSIEGCVNNLIKIHTTVENNNNIFFENIDNQKNLINIDTSIENIDNQKNLINIDTSIENIDNQKNLINIDTSIENIHTNLKEQAVSYNVIKKKISPSSRGYKYAKEVFTRLGLNFKNTMRIFNKMLSKVDNISELSCFFFEKYTLTGLDFFFDDICGSNDEEHCAAVFGIHLGFSKDEILVKKHEQDIASSLEVYVDDFKDYDDEKYEENFITTFYFSNVESERLFLVENRKNLEGFHIL